MIVSPNRATGHDTPEGACRWGLVLAVLVLILVLTLFPYELGPGSWKAAFGARFEFRPINNPLDFLANILLFLPLGVGAAACLTPRDPGRWRLAVLGLLAAGALSAGIEFVQVLLPSRSPALADVLANMMGFLLGILWWEKAVRILLRAVSRIWKCLNMPVLGALLALHLVVVIFLFQAAGKGSSLNNWETFPLLCGNEATADRPWSGRVGSLRIWDRAVDPAGPPDRSGEGLVCRYDLAGPDDLDDRLGALPAFSWHGSAGEMGDNRGVVLNQDHWLSSEGAGEVLSDIIRETGQFTISVRFATADTAQTGPGRIVSLSGNPYQRNFTLGQEGRDLVFRLRTPFTGANGSDPALIVPGILQDNSWRTVTVTYDGRAVVIRDGAGHPLGSLDLTYAGALCRGPFGYNEADRFGYAVVFWMLVWIPGIFLAGLAVKRKSDLT